jgi:hypothetical protein
VGPVPDPLLLRKSDSGRNRTRTSGSISRNSDQWTREAVLGWHLLLLIYLTLLLLDHANGSDIFLRTAALTPSFTVSRPRIPRSVSLNPLRHCTNGKRISFFLRFIFNILVLTFGTFPYFISFDYFTTSCHGVGGGGDRHQVFPIAFPRVDI